MKLLSATDVAIARAIKARTLMTVVRPTRFGGEVWCLEDDVGVIEVHSTPQDSSRRIREIEEALDA